MRASIGRIVIYKPNDEERKQFGEFGNASKELPATVVAAWGDNVVNLKVHTDGVGNDIWRPSIPEGDKQGEWHWPKKV